MGSVPQLKRVKIVKMLKWFGIVVGVRNMYRTPSENREIVKIMKRVRTCDLSKGCVTSV